MNTAWVEAYYAAPPVAHDWAQEAGGAQVCLKCKAHLWDSRRSCPGSSRKQLQLNKLQRLGKLQ